MLLKCWWNWIQATLAPQKAFRIRSGQKWLQVTCPGWARLPDTLYTRGGQTFLIAGQIWKLFLIAGRTIQNYRHESNNFCEAEKKKVFLMLNEMKNVQFLTNFVLIDRLMLLSQITKRGPRAAKISWRAACGPRAALWPRLVYGNIVNGNIVFILTSWWGHRKR